MKKAIFETGIKTLYNQTKIMFTIVLENKMVRSDVSLNSLCNTERFTFL